MTRQKNPTPRLLQIAELLTKQPGMKRAEIAEALGNRPATTGCQLWEAQLLGLIRPEGTGRHTRWYVGVGRCAAVNKPKPVAYPSVWAYAAGVSA